MAPTIYVIDEDPSVGVALESLGKLLEFPVATYRSADDFLDAFTPCQPGCLVLELKLPRMNGLELQQRLIELKAELPVIFVSAQADVRLAVEAMRLGAVTVLEKPFHIGELSDFIRRAIQLDADRRAARERQATAAAQRALLTLKEREVLEHLTAGKTNKQIAAALHLSIRAVEDRRARLMKKLGVRSLAELAQWLARNEVGS